MKTIIWFFLLWIPINCIAQLNPGAKQIALSNSDVAMSNDVFAVFNNSAGLAQLSGKQIGVFYSPSPFGLKELANAYLCANVPLSFGAFGLGIMNYGFDLYKENQINFCFASEVYNNFYAGITLNYKNISIKNYGSSGCIWVDVGFISSLFKELSWGFNFTNVARNSVGNDKNQLPSVLNAGLCYKPADDFYLDAAIEKDIDYSASLKFGIEYTIIKILSLRTGFSSEPDAFTAGIGINYLIFCCDYAIHNHPDLGMTHQFGIIIKLDSK